MIACPDFADRLVDGAALCEECAAAGQTSPPNLTSTGPKGTVA